MFATLCITGVVGCDFEGVYFPLLKYPDVFAPHRVEGGEQKWFSGRSWEDALRRTQPSTTEQQPHHQGSVRLSLKRGLVLGLGVSGHKGRGR